MDTDIVEIPPPIHVLKKQKRAMLHDVIDIDDDVDSEDLVIIGEKVSKSNKGKTIEAIHQVVEVSDYTFCQPAVENFGPVSGVESSNGYPLAILHDVIDIDDDVDPEDLVIIGEKVSSSNKGKTIEASGLAAPSKKKSAASHRSGRDLNLSLGVESSKSKRFLKSFRSKMKSASFGSKNHGLAGNPEARKLLHTGKPPAATKFKSAKKVFGNSSSYHENFKDKTLRKFPSFKQFDTVNNASDHHFIRKSSSMKQHPKDWAKAIQKEWKLLEKDLPDSIFVRVYESRMDLLRAVIIGAEGTPYHDGLFFFDVYFPSGYPDVPPLVYSHSVGDMLNPNLLQSGEVCLSLLNPWHDRENEGWLPRVSTILQVLVSIQGLILNAKPFFYLTPREYMMGSATAESESLKYSEGAFYQSLWTMIHTIGRPPKNFKDFVVGHFISRAHDILMACNAYVEGAQVGFLVKGDKSYSELFTLGVAALTTRLVEEFARIGAKDCEKFLSAANKRREAYHATVNEGIEACYVKGARIIIRRP